MGTDGIMSVTNLKQNQSPSDWVGYSFKLFFNMGTGGFREMPRNDMDAAAFFGEAGAAGTRVT